MAAWREGSRVVRERILTAPELFLKTQRPAWSAIWRWRLPSCIELAGGWGEACRRWLAGNRNKRDVRSKARRELDRMAARMGTHKHIPQLILIACSFGSPLVR